MESREHVSFLAGSANRVRILETLRENPCRQCELVRECELSRSTAHRALSGLTEREWVRREEGRYRLTAGGSVVLERYTALETAVERVAEWGPFLNHLGEAAATLSPAALDDATLVTTSPEDPHAALTQFAEAFVAGGVESFYGISPVVSPVVNEAAAELVESGVEMELLVDESVLDASRTAYPDALDDAHTAENFTLFRHPDDLGFGLAVLDDRVLVSTYDDRGVPGECLDGTGDALLEWARDTYEEHRQAATRVDLPTQVG